MSIKGDSANRSDHQGESSQISGEERAQFLKAPYEEFAWGTGLQLRGLSFKVKENSWLLVVKVTGRLDGNKVAFIETPTMLGCLDYLVTYAYRRHVPLRWMSDRFG